MESEKENATLLQKVYAKTCNIAEGTMEIIASWSIGQSILQYTDKCLWIFEKSAEWSVPVPPSPTSKQPDTNGTFGKPSPLVRPLPWVFFLPLLIMLRVIRFSLNMGAGFMGMDSVKASTVVKFFQTKRRRIRALKYRGRRKVSVKENDNVSWREKIYKTLAGTVCINYNHNDVSEKIIARENAADIIIPNADHKRKFDDVESDDDDDDGDENLLDKLNKLADKDSDEDSDYIPADSQSDDDSISEGDEEEPICTAKPLLKNPSRNSITNEVIEEENEDSDSSTVSADSEIEMKKTEPVQPKSPPKEIKTPTKTETSPSQNNKTEQKYNIPEHVDSVTSDEYYSPLNSMCPSPEPKKELEQKQLKTIDLTEPHTEIDEHEQNKQNIDENIHNIETENQIIATDNFITQEKEKNQVRNNVSLNGSNKTPGKSSLDVNSTPSNNYRGHGKKGKNRRKFSNILHRNKKK